MEALVYGDQTCYEMKEQWCIPRSISKKSVKPVYKGHNKTLKCAHYEQLPFIYRFKIYVPIQ